MTLGERVRGDFPILQRTIDGQPLVYLDSAATAQKPRAVLDALRSFYERSNANVHRSIHTLGEEATELFEAARDRVRAFVGARHREEIIFTKGTTEAINLVAHTWARRALD
ncbi:MAG: aminotransferase class V-fold PLP-dependent enzyme, partial [Candidatus Rokuibacteriota bacterium]